MNAQNQTSKSLLWTSYILQGVVSVMFLMGAANNLLKTEMAVKGATDYGYPESAVFGLGVTLLISTLLYLYPKTVYLGAILLTGWLGGAVATHAIHNDSMLFILMPVVFGVVVWVAAGLRDPRMKHILPFA